MSQPKLRKFKIEHQWLSWECEVEIDEEVALPSIKVMVEFWSGWEGRLEDHDGDYIAAWLPQLAAELMHIATSYNYNQTGILMELAKREGWCYMDGKYGIKVTCVDTDPIEEHDFAVKEEKQKIQNK